MNKICPICGRTTTLESHHIHPINLGGDEEGPQIWLCSSCHQAIHNTALLLLSKKQSSSMHPFNNDEELQRARPYIQAILNAKYWFDTQPQSNKPRRRMLTLKIGDADWQRLHKRKMDCGFKSLNKFIQVIIDREIKEVK